MPSCLSSSKPVLLIHQIASRQLVAFACDHAVNLGIRPGMTLAQARALCGDLIEAPYEPEKDFRALESLGRWLMRFSPFVAPQPPDGIFLDITGNERLFDGIDKLVCQVSEAMDRLGIRAKIALGPTVGAAWAGTFLNRSDGGKGNTPSGLCISPSSLRRSVASSLPLISLRLDESTLSTLHHLGLKTVGQLLALPRESLSQRFGPQLLLRVDQLLGHVPEVLVPLVYQPAIRARMEFDGAIESLETIWLVLKRLVKQIVDQLTRRGCGARRIDVEFKRAYASTLYKSIHLSRPSREGANLFNLLRCATESISMDAGFLAIGMSVPSFERISDEQSLLTGGEQSSARRELAQLVEMLSVRLGAEAVVQPELRESHLPERAFGTHPWSDRTTRSSASPRKTMKPVDLIEAAHASPGPLAARPLRLFPPREIQVISAPSHEDVGFPMTFAWDRTARRILHARGPERIAGIWWEGHDKTRDYYDVEDETGRRFWIFRVPQTRKWYVQGEFF